MVSPRQNGLKYINVQAGIPPLERKIVVIKMLVTGALISKGFNGADALRFSDNSENPSVRFRVGVRVYDKRAENNYRFVNLNVKAFSYLVGRIKDMKLDAGTYVNIIGRYDDEQWEDQNTHEKKSTQVLIVDEIEFCHNGGNGKQNGDSNSSVNTSAAANKPEQTPPPAEHKQTPANCSGFEGFGGTNPYFPGI